MNTCNICFGKEISYFGNIKHFKYYLCNNCNTLELSNQISTNTYEKNYKYIVDNKTRTRLVSQSKLILNYIKNNIKKHNSLLDIGSGYGYFLKEANKSFLYTLGLEPSLNLFNYSKKKLKVKALNQSFESFYKKNSNKKFDTITLIHVIEHVKKPRDFLEKALSLLKIGGILYIETPNLDSLLFQTEQKKYTFLTPPEHIYIFSRKSFHFLLKGKLSKYFISSYTYSYNEHIIGILKACLKKHSEKIGHFEAKRLTVFDDDRTSKRLVREIRKNLFFILFHTVFAPIIRFFVDLMHKGTFLELYIKKIR